MSIRTRLLLLVFAVWLPAVIGFSLLARSTYLREEEAARQRIQQLGQSLSFAVEGELDNRAVMAKTLGASTAIRDGDLKRFHEEASVATRGGDGWALLVSPTQQLTNTRLPFGGPPLPRPPGAPTLVTTGEPKVLFSVRGSSIDRPVIGVFAPEGGVTPPRYNVAIGFEPAVIQAIVDQHAFPEGTLAAVIDDRQRVMARSRDPAKWLGREATGDVKKRAEAGQDGFAASVTLDGIPSLTYLTPPSRYHWTVVIALPLSSLSMAAQRVTLQAIAASGTLLIIGLLLALYAARRISDPVLALRQAAATLGDERVPPMLSTGVSEADDVSAALHHAGRRSHEATRTLELRVTQAVQQAEQAQAKLLEGQKREAIGRLTGGLAHDFNNLLQTISTGLQVMDRGVGVDAPQRRVLQASMRACAKAADLVRQMLTFGRAQPLEPRAVDFNDFLLKSQELTSTALGQRVGLSASIAPGLPPLFVDPTQLELALLNLVFNARDAIPQGGHVGIHARLARPGEAATLGDAGGDEAARWVCLEVSDDGQGMDAETLAKAVEPYFTTKPVGAGSGLGLSQVHAFAKQSGGDLRLASTPGQGSRISLFLPTCDEADTPLDALPPAETPQRPLRILMVEDDVLVSSVVVPALEGAGHRVLLCGSADEALARLSAAMDGEAPAFDALFTDVVMPGKLTGMDLAAWCQAHRPALRVVVATGYTAQQTDPAVQLLRKPYGLEAMMAALQGQAEAPR